MLVNDAPITSSTARFSITPRQALTTQAQMPEYGLTIPATLSFCC